jgi:hypothetical protein
VAEFVNAQWHLKWITRGVRILGWHRVEHTSLFLPPHPEGISGWLFNAETYYELDRLQAICGAYRYANPGKPMGVVPLGKMEHFPTGLLEKLNMFLLPECFIQEDGDKSIQNCVEYWTASDVHLGRINPMILFKPGIRTDPTAELEEQLYSGAWGLSTFTGENTPTDSWNIIGGYRNRIYVPR